MPTKIIIYVEGGVVQDVYTMDETVEVTIVDLDNDEGEQVYGFTPQKLSRTIDEQVKYLIEE